MRMKGNLLQRAQYSPPGGMDRWNAWRPTLRLLFFLA
jgi:hypothetical protein